MAGQSVCNLAAKRHVRRGLVLWLLTTFAADHASSRDIKILDPRPSSLPVCGSRNSPPFARPGDIGRRECGRTISRHYTPRHRGIGYTILDLESDACFVPDDAYRLLDAIVDEVKVRVAKKSGSRGEDSARERILAIGQATSAVLTDRGFGLSIPTETLGDTLISRNSPGESPRHIFDCDTASMIFLTVADALSTPASLVEITLPGGDQHNYVRWQVGRNAAVDWDPNGRSQCTTPTNIEGYQGRSLNRDQTISYVLTLRAELWARQHAFDRAIQDYREAMRLFPMRPGAFVGFAWLVATNDFPGRATYRQAAVTAAERAVALRQIPDYLDTLACAYALAGDFSRAANTEREAHQSAPSISQYLRRLEQFEASQPADCSGAEQ